MGDVLGHPDPDHRRKSRPTEDTDHTDHPDTAENAENADRTEPIGHRREASDGDAVAFPARLRSLRGERGLSLADLARRTHYSKGYLSKIETGAKPATPDVARRCDEVLRAGGELLRLVRETGPPGAVPGPRPAGAAPSPAGDCPYRGLPAFTARDAGWFFGRERATAELVERVFERVGSGPLLLVAPSGAGKSSLLNAGLVPAFRRPGGFPMPGADAWPVVRFTPTAHPLEELLDRTAKVLGGDPGITVREVRERPEVLLEAVSRWSDDARPGDSASPPVRPVLLVDQFEELFTLCSDENERRAFVRVLSCVSSASRAAAAGQDPAVVVLGVRADFSGSCMELPELAAAFTEGLFVLPPMSVAELRASVTRPAELAGVTLEPGLVPLLLRDAGLRGDASDRTPSGALPLVSHTLRATWQERTGDTLTVAGYEKAGGIQGAVARTAETVFARLYPAEQKTIRRVLVRLVHVADGAVATRRRVARAALLGPPDGADRAAAALDPFVRARLVTMDRDTVEITHEALLHAWPRLRGWIHADRAGLLIHQQLAHAAAEWEREGRDPSALYRGTRLDTARSWADELDGRSRLGTAEEAFLRASRAVEDGRRRQARRQVRLRQRMLATLLVLLVLAVGAGGLAYQERTAALGQERVARSRALALQSAALAAGQPEGSMLLAGQAYRTEPTAEARGALLSTQSQPFVTRLGGHDGPVNAVAFSPDDSVLATAGSDGRVALRRLSDHRTTAAFTLPGRVRAVAFGPGGRTLAAASTDGPARVWDTSGRSAVTLLPAVTAGARALAFAPDGRTLAVAASDGTVLLWETGGEHRVVGTLTGHTGRVNALAYAPDGRTLVSAGADRTVRLWDPSPDPGRERPGARETAVLYGHSDEVLGAAFAPDGRTVATGGVDRTVRLWDVAGRRATATLSGHSDDVNGVAYTPDGTTVVSAGGDGTTQLWDARGGRPTATFAGHTDYVLGVAVDSGGTLLATAGFDQSVVLWDLRGPVLTARPFTEIWHAAYSRDGKLLATAQADHTVRLWDVAGRRVLATFTGHGETVFSVAFSPDGRTLASAGSDGTVRLWDVAARAPAGILTSLGGTVFSVAFSPDGRTLASAGSDGTIRLWDVAARRPLALLAGHTDFANCVVFSPDGRTLASAGDDLTVRLWDVAARGPLDTLTGHTGAVRAVAFSPDGRTLASSGNDGTVRLWDARSHRFDAALSGHTGSARGIAFSPDGRTLASSGNDRTVRLWDVAGRRAVAALAGHGNAVWGVVFAPDGRTVASSSTDGTVRLWDLDVRARLAELCRLAAGGPATEPRAPAPAVAVPRDPGCPRG
ncbi:helix-turn-helix domain-containing protein [Streptomyces sp. H27-S2]|uniref:nSTAND1 domain-containing NTPase n=1 Tax=Streptomyces antarcticus TaxID=2996458 RepID=UPI00226DA0F8|nr:helix-turn-helix domain-containing protein [Streptomyces sp. H27-S2]MCY0949212.1 helix-turn-helix domain-containing protein [Streptomyces sp. H27-S2]